MLIVKEKGGGWIEKVRIWWIWKKFLDTREWMEFVKTAEEEETHRVRTRVSIFNITILSKLTFFCLEIFAQFFKIYILRT